MSDKWILDGKKPVRCDLMTWAQWFETADRHVANDKLPGDVSVSTVFLGIDHSFGLGGPPLLFETMIFGGPHDEYQERYSTWDEAEAGHERALKLALSPPDAAAIPSMQDASLGCGDSTKVEK